MRGGKASVFAAATRERTTGWFSSDASFFFRLKIALLRSRDCLHRPLFPLFGGRAPSPLWQPTRLPRGGGRPPQQQQQQQPLEQRRAASSTWSRSRSPSSKRRELLLLPHRPRPRRATSEPGRSSRLRRRRHSRPTTSSSAVRPSLATGAGAEAGSPRRPTLLRDTVPCRSSAAPTGGSAAAATRAPPRQSSKGLQTRGRRSWAAASKCSAVRPCR